MKTLVIGISDCQVSVEPDSELVTYALGSCIAVSVWDPLRRIAGLLHFMLPESNIDVHKAEANPWMFADTGIERLFKVACEKGAERRRLVVRLAGGAQVLDPQGVFNIGKRNYLAARKILCRVISSTFSGRPNARETVDAETPAALATSRMVAITEFPPWLCFAQCATDCTLASR